LIPAIENYSEVLEAVMVVVLAPLVNPYYSPDYLEKMVFIVKVEVEVAARAALFN